MVMPVRQMCPSCRNWFVGSDAIGGLCDWCLTGTLPYETVAVWACPEHHYERIHCVTIGDQAPVATCAICGRKSTDR